VNVRLATFRKVKSDDITKVPAAATVTECYEVTESS